jgi:hypothetical protein
LDPIVKQRNFRARALATIVACLLLLQTALAGAAVAYADTGRDRVICATQDASGAPSVDGRPMRQHGGHRHGMCCILHCGALDAPPQKQQVSIEVLTFPGEVVASSPKSLAPVFRMEPKGAPQSPRAPPFRDAAFS